MNGTVAKHGEPPRVTALLPVFLRQATASATVLLERALESVLTQRYPADFEVLIVDDGSPTPIAELLAGSRWLAPPVRIIRSERNNGLVHALNLGLRCARHEYIARIDADDCWCDGKMEKQLARFGQDAGLSIVGTGMRLVADSGELIEEIVRADGWKQILDFFVEVGCPFPHGSVVALKSVYELLGGYPHDSAVAHCEDYALWGLWLRFFRPAMVEELLYDYTVSSSSVSAIHARQQRAASGRVNQAFARLRINSSVPAAMPRLARALGCSELQAGAFCYRAWKYRPLVRVPEEAVDPLHEVLVDRDLEVASRDTPGKIWEADELFPEFGSPEGPCGNSPRVLLKINL